MPVCFWSLREVTVVVKQRMLSERVPQLGLCLSRPLLVHFSGSALSLSPWHLGNRGDFNSGQEGLRGLWSSRRGSVGSPFGGVGGLCFGVGNPGELLCSLSSSAHDVVREVSVSEFALSRDGLVGSSEPGFRLSSESPGFLRGRCGFLISLTGCAPLLLVQFSSFHPILPTLKCAVNSMLKASGRESFPE
ncbi:hypothetical protein Bca4012_058964 [Brassica carinata]